MAKKVPRLAPEQRESLRALAVADWPEQATLRWFEANIHVLGALLENYKDWIGSTPVARARQSLAGYLEADRSALAALGAGDRDYHGLRRQADGLRADVEVALACCPTGAVLHENRLWRLNGAGELSSSDAVPVKTKKPPRL